MKEIHVHIGEVKIAKNGEVLKALLGSCVGIGLIWRERGLCGLAHCLLPSSPGSSFAISGRFVTQAIPSLVALMKIKPENFEKIEAVVAGGGNMTNPDATDPNELVGFHNSQTAEEGLKKLGIRIVFLDVGGTEGRKVSIDSRSGSYHVEKMPRIIGAA